MEKLYGWLFTFNHYTGHWYAAKRDDYNLLFSGAHTRENAKEKVLRSKDIQTLQEIIIKTGGDPAKIKQLVK